MGTDKRDMSNWKQGWLQEERSSFQGWDFSALSGRMEEEELPWDYEAAVRDYIRGTTGNLLDMGTGGENFCSPCPRPGDVLMLLRPIRLMWSCAGSCFRLTELS